MSDHQRLSEASAATHAPIDAEDEAQAAINGAHYRDSRPGYAVPVGTSFNDDKYHHHVAIPDDILQFSGPKERARNDELAHIVPGGDTYSEELYGENYRKIMELNNTIYRFTYVYFLLFLSVVVGIVTSFVFGLLIATVEFFNLWVIRPCLKIARTFAEPWIVCSRLVAAIAAPLLELMLSGTYKNLRVSQVVGWGGDRDNRDHHVKDV